MKRRNRIKEIINQKFGLKPQPTRELLEKFNMTPTRFNHIIDNRGSREMDALEIKRLADWLEVEETELWEENQSEDEVRKRHGILI